MLIKAADSKVKLRHLWSQELLDRFVHGKAMVVNGATHLMLLTHAAAGVCAVKLIAATEVLFEGVERADVDLFSERLEMLDRLVLLRYNSTMILPGGGLMLLGVPNVEERVRKYYSVPLGSQKYSSMDEGILRRLVGHSVYVAA